VNLFISRTMQSKQIDRVIALDVYHITFELQSSTALLVILKKRKITTQSNIIQSLQILGQILSCINQ